MRRDTHERDADLEPGLTMEQRIARARTRRPRAPLAVTEPTLPTPGLEVPMVTLTTDQLHDLIHAAASQYLQSLSNMARDRARHHASRIAAQADLILHTEHTVYRGRPE